MAGGGPGGGGEAEVEYEDGVTWVIDDKAAASQADRAARPKGEVTAEMQAAAKRQKGIKAGWLADPTCAEVRSRPAILVTFHDNRHGFHKMIAMFVAIFGQA